MSGVSPIIDVADARAATEAETGWLDTFAVRGGLPGIAGLGLEDEHWRYVADGGLRYVDTLCLAYVEELASYESDKRAITSEIGLVGTTVTAGLGLANAPSMVLAAVALAFGAAGATVENFSSTVLYSLPASAIGGLIERAQAAYRVEVDRTRNAIHTRAAASAVVSDYLTLCLPTFLEQQITGAVTETGFAASGGSATGGPSLTRTSTAPTPAAAAAGTLDVRAPITVTPPAPISDRCDGLAGDEAAFLVRSQCREIQAALCTGADGTFATDTRTAIGLYRRATGSAGGDRPLTALEAAALETAGPCDRAAYANAYERFAYDRAVSFEGRGPEKLAGDLETLRRFLASTGVTVPAGDRLAAPGIRDAIKAAQQSLGQPATGAMTPQFRAALAAAVS